MLRMISLIFIAAGGLYLVFGGLEAMGDSKGMRLTVFLIWIGTLLGWFFIPAKGGGRKKNSKDDEEEWWGGDLLKGWRDEDDD